MANEARDLQRQEPQGAEVERTRANRVFIPRVDIVERNEEIVLTADMPGVSEKNVDITVDKNVLTITGKVEDARPQGHALTLREYDVGDFQRVFTLPNQIDQEHIHASVRNGVLRLVLPKAQAAKAKKIEVKPAT
jgi:HSP20 family molecular chaperone IbpA